MVSKAHTRTHTIKALEKKKLVSLITNLIFFKSFDCVCVSFYTGITNTSVILLIIKKCKLEFKSSLRPHTSNRFVKFKTFFAEVFTDLSNDIVAH